MLTIKASRSVAGRTRVDARTTSRAKPIPTCTSPLHLCPNFCYRNQQTNTQLGPYMLDETPSITPNTNQSPTSAPWATEQNCKVFQTNTKPSKQVKRVSAHGIESRSHYVHRTLKPCISTSKARVTAARKSKRTKCTYQPIHPPPTSPLISTSGIQRPRRRCYNLQISRTCTLETGNFGSKEYS